MPLTDSQVRFARARDRAYKLSDGAGLCLLIQPTGSKWWRYRYRWEGRERMLSMGTYPPVSLVQARERREEARRLLVKRIDPGAVRRERREADRSTFEGVARDYLMRLSRHVHDNKRSAETLKKSTWIIERFLLPDLGSRSIGSITSRELLLTLKKIEGKNLNETARRAKQKCGQIFRHAIGLGVAERDITYDLDGLLETPIVTHHASITDPKQVGALLRTIDTYKGAPEVVAALRLAPLLFVRPGELRSAQWEHIDLEKAEWRIPAELMKMRRPHIVPLSRQAVAILIELKDWTGEGRYVFPMGRDPGRMMGDFAINKALRSLGYSGTQVTGHGFRSMASTLLNENGWDTEAIERQLAHVEGNGVKAAYNYAQHLPTRREMMQWWADYLDELRGPGEPSNGTRKPTTGGTVVPFPRPKRMAPAPRLGRPGAQRADQHLGPIEEPEITAGDEEASSESPKLSFWVL